MARTKASVGARVSSVKSSKVRAASAPAPSYTGSSGGSDKSKKNYSGGNPVCPRETPKWQKPITNFFQGNSKPKPAEENEAPRDIEVAGSSKTNKNPKRNVIESSDDEIETIETPRNSTLDESIDLLPLDGEHCHKMDEYFSETNKKENKENVNINRGKKRTSSKRELNSSNEDIQENKRIKT